MEFDALVQRALEGKRDAVEALLVAIQPDVFRLCTRMFGAGAEAEDATQEVLLKLLTHLDSFRGESSFRTWAWHIATHHVLRAQRTRREQATDFGAIEAMIDEGDHLTSDLVLETRDAHRLAEEVRVGCTEAMLLALDRPQRLAYVLADVFDLPAEDAAQLLDIEPATFRKRLQRARARLAAFLERKCGLSNPVAACRCVRQIPVLARHGLLDPSRPAVEQAWRDMRAIEGAAKLFAHPPREAPPRVLGQIRQLLSSVDLFRLPSS